ncbi:MAG: HAMP domain-containing histidine kinase [Oscillospiraceae bacterium]|nr:HAMP domain-containing histidine kinase [Oscillospiraceae bacterium]
MRVHKDKKKARLRQRILAAFSLVLFFSLLVLAVGFNIAIRLLSASDSYYYAEQDTTGRAGITLFVLVGIMFVVSVVVTYFLSNSITRPIERLGKFALGIGNGNFDTNDFTFRDIELENLNAALNKSVRQLGVYDSAQKDFFQNASHELRTPLMSIKVYAEGIIYDLMDAKQAGETILEETDRLSELVANLLYIAKIDNVDSIATLYAAEKVDLKEVIKTCTARQQAVADKKQIVFSFDSDDDAIFYICSAELMARAVDNLISNAIRYAMSTITLSCRKEDNNIVIRIADDGNGIESEVLPHVFERFYKGMGGNTGIGLSIVKSIADRHDGWVTAENVNNGGAAFTITLPDDTTQRR